MKEHEERIAGIVGAAERAHRRAAPDRAREVHALINYVAAKAGVPRPARRAAPSPSAAGNGKPKAAASHRASTRPQPSAQPPRSPDRLWSIDTLPPPETGGYEIAHELSHCGASVVYAARQGGGDDGAPPRFAVKVTRPPGIWSMDDARRHVRDFLAAASLQKRVAESRPAAKGHWAPVHGEPTEIPGQGAWYATDRFDRSAEDLASSQRGPIAERDLWQLVSGVVDGLEQLEQAAQRPHGKLKAGNVLLAGRTGRFRAALTDPLADEAAARQSGRAADLRQLGDLVRKLVLRDTGGTDAATASLLGAPSAWAHLGRFANPWREFCGALLEGGERYPTFDDLRAAIRPLSPAVRRRKHVGAVLAAVLLIVVGSVAYYLYSHRYQPEQWEKLCDQWDWYDRTYDALKSDIGKAVLGAALGDKAASPTDIALRSGTPAELRQLGRDNTPPALFAGKETIRTSLRAIDALHARLLPGPSPFWKDVDARIEAIEKEPVEKNLANRLRLERNAVVAWIESEAIPTAPATQEHGGEQRPVWYQFGDLLKLGTPSGNQPGVLARVAAVNASCARIRAAGTWKDGAAETTDAFLSRVVHDVQVDLDRQPVKSLAEDDAVVKGYESLLVRRVLDKLGDGAASRFYWKGLTAVDAASLGKLPDLKDSSPLEPRYGDVVDSWITAAADYQILPAIPDPKKWEAEHPVKDMSHRLQLARDEGTADGELTQRMDNLGREIGQLQALKTGIESHTFVKKESTLLYGQLDQLARTQAKLEALLRAVEEEAQVPDEWLAAITKAQAPPDLKSLNQELRFHSTAVAKLWSEEKDRLVQQLPANHTKSQVAKLFADVQLKLTKTARKLDEELPVAAVDAAAPAWARPFYDVRAERRELLLEQLRAKVLADPNPVVQLSDALLQPVRDQWANWQKALADWVQLGVRLQGALAPEGGLYAIGDPLPGEPGTLGERLRAWLDQPQKDADASHTSLNDACKKELAVVKALTDHLEKLADHPDAADVRGTLTNPNASAPEVWAAWWAADHLRNEERLPLKSVSATQPSELRARDAALALAGKVERENRGSTLAESVRKDAVNRWLRRAKPSDVRPAAKQGADWPAGYDPVLQALQCRSDFGITNEILKNDPKAQYNVRLAELIQKAPPIPAPDKEAAEARNAEARKLWQDFLADLNGIPLAGASDKAKAELVRQLTEAETQAQRGQTAPASAPLEDRGWHRLPVNPGGESELDVMTFEPPVGKAPILEFRRVDPPRGESQFVLRNAVTVEQFNGVLRKMHPGQVISADAPITEGEPGSPSQFAVWDRASATTGELAILRTAWLQSPPAAAGVDPVVRGKADLGAPSLKLPAVSLSPQIMEAWAERLGLHVSTLSEWRAAWLAEQARGGTRTWNLRDAAWQTADVHYQDKLKRLDGTNGLNPRGWRRFRGDKLDDATVWDRKTAPPMTAPFAGPAYDDGAVLLLPAEPDAAQRSSGTYGYEFFHILGNVWQLVRDDDDNQDKSNPPYAVIGASAFSPPTLGCERPQVLNGLEAQFGRPSDVGFRVSFKAPRQPARIVLVRALQNAGKFLGDD